MRTSTLQRQSRLTALSSAVMIAALGAAASASAQTSGTLDCAGTKTAVVDAVAYLNEKAEFFGKKQTAVRLHLFKTKLTDEEKQWWAARDATRKKPDGSYMQAADFGFGGAILKDIKRQNEIQSAILLRFNLDLRDGFKTGLLDQKGLNNPKIGMFSSADCGGAHRNNTFARGALDKVKVGDDFQAFTAELKADGKLAFASKQKIPADPAGKAPPKIDIGWDTKGTLKVLALP